MRISDWSSDVCSSDLADDVTAAEDAAHRYALNLGEGQIAIETVIDGDILVIGLVALRRLDAKFDGRIVADGDRGAIIDPPLIENLDGVAVLVINLVEIEIGCKIGRASCRARVCQYV